MVLDLSADLRGSSRLSGAQITEDLAWLKAALVKGYAGPNFLRQVDSVAISETSSSGLCGRLAQLFDRVRDAHLHAALEFRACGSPPSPGKVGENLASDEQWLLKSVVHNGGTVDVLAIPSFWPRYDARWNGFLDAVKELRAKGRPFVVDLRGNGGGDDSMGFELARILLGLDQHVNLPSPVESRRFLQSPESFALQSNEWAYSILRLRAQNQPVPVYMTQRRDEILTWMARAKEGQFTEEYLETLPEQRWDQRQVFQSEVYVLIDRACASSCETTMQVLENLPHRVLVGENTFGAVEHGEVGRLILPNSKISVSLSTMNVQFRDGRHVEKTGYAPDLRVPEGGDALTAALRTIRSTIEVESQEDQSK